MPYKVNDSTPLNRDTLQGKFVVTHLSGEDFSAALATNITRSIEKKVAVTIPGVPGKTIIDLDEVVFVLESADQRDGVIKAFLGLGDEADKRSEKLLHERTTLITRLETLDDKLAAISVEVENGFNAELAKLYPAPAPVVEPVALAA